MIDRTKEPKTLWEIKFERLYYTWIIKAHTFVDAVEEAKLIAEREGIDIDDLTAVRYMMY